MGLFKKVFRPVRKIAKKIIPKEVRPFLPYIAAGFGPSTAGLSFGSGLGTALTKRALIAGATSAATDEQGDPLRAGLLAIAPNIAAEGLGAVASKFPMAGDDPTATFSFAEKIGEGARRGQDFIERQGAIKTIGAQTAIDQAAKFAEINQDEIDKYNEELRKQGVLDKTKRRTSIFNIYKNAGYDDDYVNSMLDRYGYNEGGLTRELRGLMSGRRGRAMRGVMTMDDLLKKTPVVDEEEEEKITVKRGEKGKVKPKDSDVNITFESEEKEPNYAEAMSRAMSGVEAAFGVPFNGVKPAEFKRFAQGGEVKEEGIMSKIVDSMGDDYDYFTRIKIRKNLKQGETMEDAVDLAEQEAMGIVKEKYGFAQGGEVEIEEETDDLNIMDLMRDQGIEYGEQVSAPGPKDGYDDIARQLFGKGYKDLTPEELELFQEELERLMNKFRSRMDDEGIMQMASGYKTDIEEMYEQYVFEMEEQGLQPMSFSEFLAQARAGMKDGGKVRRRKKGEPMDDDGEKPGPSLFPKVPKGEFFLDKMPKPKKMDGIMQAADGGIMEKDMRGGGFIPEGSKERADDVPARLSKNEFVMTADAVRAAGGGSVNKGAKRMYDMMYSLEGKV